MRHHIPQSRRAQGRRTAMPVLLVPLLMLAGCSTAPEPVEMDAPDAVDMSGHWEKNYSRSDDFNARFNLFLFDLQRSSTPSAGRGVNETLGSGGVGGGSRESVIGLARLTEEITRMPLLEIEQSEDIIHIHRDGTFALRCEHHGRPFVRMGNPFGSEICGWNGEQLIFQMDLEGGLGIRHQVTLGPEQRQLNITTTVSSSAVSRSITVSNYYERYRPQEADFDCIYTLTRNNVCTRKRN